ncbi:hypothetical protein GPM19_07410 [Halomonas sp. ZH2S]|uniref:Uncharacterized protein n=1 Tax=Vreelandella zhuhanensis TaxID=2684210 RepID=A0A7X3H1X2_9GAMM|nr:hypothetical protein [Halomonas zhuhanensis]MWJ28030.1 hypothetical protein [Halomonas zhuhanensis]
MPTWPVAIGSSYAIADLASPEIAPEMKKRLKIVYYSSSYTKINRNGHYDEMYHADRLVSTLQGP